MSDTPPPPIFSAAFPETISIRSSSRSGGVMDEGMHYSFSCDIHNVAPVQNVTVMWYKGDAMVYREIIDNPSKEPVNHTSVLSVTPTREDNGVTFRCEAMLDLLPEGPQLIASSQEFNITVYCEYITCARTNLKCTERHFKWSIL